MKSIELMFCVFCGLCNTFQHFRESFPQVKPRHFLTGGHEDLFDFQKIVGLTISFLLFWTSKLLSSDFQIPGIGLRGFGFCQPDLGR